MESYYNPEDLARFSDIGEHAPELGKKFLGDTRVRSCHDEGLVQLAQEIQHLQPKPFRVGADFDDGNRVHRRIVRSDMFRAGAGHVRVIGRDGERGKESQHTAQ